jgi:hypothetical protein
MLISATKRTTAPATIVAVLKLRLRDPRPSLPKMTNRNCTLSLPR